MSANRLAIAVAAGLLGCAQAATEQEVIAALEARGLGREALGIPANIFVHDGWPRPALLMPMVRDLLAKPMSLPAEAEKLAARLPPSLLHTDDATLLDFDAALAALIDELVEARAQLRLAVPPELIDREVLLAEVSAPARRKPRIEALAMRIDHDRLERANDLFYAAVMRFVARLDRLGTAAVEGPRRFESPLGTVVVGSSGNDDHGPAAVIVDPGGDDSYRRAVAPGEVSVIVDLAGDDRYYGDDAAIGALVAIVDLSGDDHYESFTAGNAAALAGGSLLIDRSGNDRYRNGAFGQGAAIFGRALLLDFDGNDRYEIASRGQGYGGPGGLGILWDQAGDDTYVAAGGMADPFQRRGGGLSYVQGFGEGFRHRLAGGVGLLRDDGGADRFAAEMFAQGAGYHYGIGILASGAGDDSYDAARYAQGQGSHGGIGMLRDRSGNDEYRLEVGVGQGMGLDIGIGVLRDDAGDDSFAADNLAQGSTAANGFGLLVAGGGANRYSLGAPGDGWGRGRDGRGLPGLAFLLDYGPKTTVLGGQPFQPQDSATGGPLGGLDDALGAPPGHACPERREAPVAGDAIELLGRAAPVFGSGPDRLAAYAALLGSLPESLPGMIAALPEGDVALNASLRNIVGCFLEDAGTAERAAVRRAAEAALAAAPHSLNTGLLVALLRRAGITEAPEIGEMLRGHPDCGIRAAAVALAPSTAAAALADSCWQVQAAALAALAAEPAATVTMPEAVPRFLRQRFAAPAPGASPRPGR